MLSTTQLLEWSVEVLQCLMVSVKSSTTIVVVEMAKKVPRLELLLYASGLCSILRDDKNRISRNLPVR